MHRISILGLAGIGAAAAGAVAFVVLGPAVVDTLSELLLLPSRGTMAHEHVRTYGRIRSGRDSVDGPHTGVVERGWIGSGIAGR